MGTTGSEMTMPPFEVILGMIGIVLFGIILGALIMLPIVQKKSNYPLEVLSGDLIWRYVPDWLLFFIGSIVFLILSFLLVTGWLHTGS